MARHEPVQKIKERRDGILATLVRQVPFHTYMGIRYERRGDELTAIMAYDPKLIGDPASERLHGGATAAFLECTALVTLAWARIWDQMEAETFDLEGALQGGMPPLPKTIDFAIDYLRPGLPRDAYARARINRSGRRYASVHVEAWQDHRDVLFSQATGHFLIPQPPS